MTPWLSFLALRALLVDGDEVAHLREATNLLHGRRLQEESRLPTGVTINGLGNSSVPIIVVPTWDIFLGFNDRQKLIQGRMTLVVVYPSDATTFVQNPASVVDVDNFGSGEKYHSGTISVTDTSTMTDLSSQSTVYVGEFSQALTDFDMTCYPFDAKRAKIFIGLLKPADMIFSLSLGCVGEGTVPYWRDDGRHGCRWPVKGSFVGFDWHEWICEEINGFSIECGMVGIRQPGPLFATYLLPSVLYSLMGFLAFALNVKMTMPRVATTMLALVSLTNLRNHVLTLVPSSGPRSWMEEYFLLAMIFMFLNLVGHCVSFYLDSVGRTKMQQMANKVNLWGMLSLFLLIAMILLHSRECQLVDEGLASGLVVSCAALNLLVFLFLAWHHREAFRERLHHLPQLHHSASMQNSHPENDGSEENSTAKL
ncbi:unnamed protein product [Effrenium voratum]|nr:unnamed protein product [Effrenium voratum]